MLRLLLAAWFLTMLVHAAGLGNFVATRGGIDYEIGRYEGTHAHWAWQVRAGRPLYPDGDAEPYAANAFGPLYFWSVGGAARVFGARHDDMLLWCRAAAFAAYLATTALLAFAVRERGGLAVLAAAGVALAPQAAQPFSLMARADTLGELLGFAGFLLAFRTRRTSAFGSATLLAAALLARQTAGMFAFAALLGLCLEGRPRRGLAVFAGALAGFAGALALATLREPRIVGSLFLEGHAAFSVRQAWTIVQRMLEYCPEACLLLALAGASGAKRWAALAGVLAVLGALSAGKVGSDLNYLLAWRLPAGWAAAELVARAASDRRLRVGFLLALVVAASGWSAARTVAGLAWNWHGDRDPRNTPAGREQRRQLVLLARGQPALTDDPLLAFQMQGEAPFVNVALAGILARRERLDTAALEGRIARGELARAILRMDPFAPDYGLHAEALPPRVAARLRERYRCVGALAGRLLFEPR